MDYKIVSYFLNIAKTSKIVGFLTNFFSHLGTYMAVILVPSYLLYKTVNKINMFCFLFTSFLTTWFIGELVKHLIKLPRPFQAHEFIPLFGEVGFSFPSLHSSFAGVLIALACIFRFPMWYVVIIFSLCIGLSRVFSGVHYMSDVLVGFCFGISITCAFYFSFNYFKISL